LGFVCPTPRRSNHPEEISSMPKIRVLVVDDSVVIRRLISEALSADPAIEVVGSAANGRIALEKIPQVNPDLISLDVEMPEMDGLATLAVIRKTYPRLPVIMFSSLTERGAAVTLEALTLGASDYVTKPANVGNLQNALESVREEILPKIKALCSRGDAHPLRTTPFPDVPRAKLPDRPPASQARVAARNPVQIVAVGVSTGGPNALAALMPVFPAGFPVPIVIVQHMPPIFTKLLADRLATKASIAVKEAVKGTVLKPGTAWIAPGNFHMVVQREGVNPVLNLNQDPPENSCRPAADALFRSVAQVYGASTLAVVLTGMGQDGLRGCEAIHECGGQILIQDEASSVVWGMPGFVARAGLADKELPLDQLGHEIMRRVQNGQVKIARGISGA
jgi:two-component system chemotaxis response regulator CheB